jgi:hypothetical protein
VTLIAALREQIRGLAERLQELSLPGAKATFAKQLETGRVEADKIPLMKIDQQADRLVPPTEERRFLQLAEKFPEAAVLERYKTLEAIIERIGRLLNLGDGVKSSAVLDELLKRKLIEMPTFTLFNTLRQARNVAAHSGGEKRITPGEALDYGEQADKVSGRLWFVVGQLEGLSAKPLVDPSRFKERGS